MEFTWKIRMFSYEYILTIIFFMKYKIKHRI